ncbi:MAG: hypothetical protein HY747_11670 [Elusimicrobia bacterium]|nr:hypothetical protein [Elusimicrobiota bacterium]
MTIKRQTEQIFCKYCGEPKSLGNHAIALDLAQKIEKEKCRKCGTMTMAVCWLGLGHFVYLCEKCGKQWSNIDT